MNIVHFVIPPKAGIFVLNPPNKDFRLRRNDGGTIFTKMIEWMVYIWIIVLPWQTRWIVSEGRLNGGPWEYGTISLYVSELVLFMIFILFLIEHFFVSKKKIKIFLEKKQKIVVVILITFFVLGFFSLYWSFDRNVAGYGLWKLTEALILFFIIQSIDFSPKKLMLVFIMSAVLVSAFGIYQFLAQEVSANTWLGLAGHLPQNAGDSVIETSELRILRLYGSLPHPNITAAFLGIGLIFSAYFHSLKERSDTRNFFKLWFLWGSWIILLSGFVLTMSRGAWISLLIAVVIAFIFSVLRKGITLGGAGRFLPITVVSLLLGGFWYGLLPDVFLTRLAGSDRLETRSIDERIGGYQDFNRLLSNHWLEGVGLGNYTLALNKEINQNRESHDYQPVHNSYLVMVTELGIFSLFSLAVLLWSWFKGAWFQTIYQQDKSSTCFINMATLFLVMIGFFDHFLWTIAFGVLLWWLMLALTMKDLKDSFKDGILNM